MGPQRPNLVGLICWILILGGFGSVVSLLKSSGGIAAVPGQDLPYPLWLELTLQYGPRALMVIAGICLYERQGWARYFYIVVMLVFLGDRLVGLLQEKTRAVAPILHSSHGTTVTPVVSKLPLHEAELGVMVALFLASLVILIHAPRAALLPSAEVRGRVAHLAGVIAAPVRPSWPSSRRTASAGRA